MPARAQDTSHVETHPPAADSARPIITPEGVGAALLLEPSVREAIASHVVAIDAQLRKMLELHQRQPNERSESERQQLRHEMEAVHDQMMQHHHAIHASLTVEQRAAFMRYVHERAEAAGLKMRMMEDHEHPGRHTPGRPHH